MKRPAVAIAGAQTPAHALSPAEAKRPKRFLSSPPPRVKATIPGSWSSPSHDDTSRGGDACAIVRNLDECINWFDDVVSRFGGLPFVEELNNKLGDVKLSTAFSGVGAPDIALHTLQAGAHRWMARAGARGDEALAKPSYTNLFAIEKDHECQLELRLLPVRPLHIFDDMLKFIDASIYTTVMANLARWTYDDLLKMAMRPTFVQKSANCVLHPCCECETERADVHVAGSPCVDFTLFNNDAMELQGPMLAVFMAWISQRRRLQEPFILHENVVGIHTSSTTTPIEQGLGDMYVVQTVIMDAFELGHPVSRERRLTWLLHKAHVRVAPSTPWPESKCLFLRILDPSVTYHIYLVAGEHELQADLDWCKCRDTHESLEHRRAHADRMCSEYPDLPHTFASSEWFQSLICSEQNRCVWYRDLMPEACLQKHALAGLMQDPRFKPYHNNGKRTMMCVVKNAHIIFDYVSMRAVHPKELLLTQAFPMWGMGEPGSMSSFSNERPWHMPPRRRQVIVSQAGNSMNIHMVACAFVWLAKHFNVKAQGASSSGNTGPRRLLALSKSWASNSSPKAPKV